ncbi:MAG: permease-like cell division protein FtsX [Paludibacteraceae bacterium]|nr:permease-like cell division protein FtsX [Paludibacteraceae bacterium]
MSKRKFRFFNTYLTATISVALVLLLIGMECVISLGTSSLLRQLKEETTITLVLSDEMTSSDSVRVSRLLDVAPFCKRYQYISKEQALAEHIAELGEDPTLCLDYNPIHAAFELKLSADYVHPDSVAKIEQLLAVYPFVEHVDYPRAIVGFFQSNVSRVLWVLLAIASLLLFISIVLIVNTIRLTVYSRRFIIHTMKLVGATPWMIKGPIVRRSMRMGLYASILAMMLIFAVLYGTASRYGFVLFAMTWQNIAVVAVVILLSGVLLTFLSSLFAVNKYIRLKVDDLYII